MSLFAHNKGNYDPVTTAAIAAAANKQNINPTTPNSGTVYKVFLPVGTSAYNANPPYTQLTINANSFVILDAPSSVVVKSDIFPEQVFQERTGQTFSQNFQFLQLKINTETADPTAWNDNISPVSAYINGITVTIWAGISNTTGYIDNRTQPSRNSFEITVPCYNSGGPKTFQSCAGTTLTTYDIAPQYGVVGGTSPDTYYNLNFAQFTLKDLIISNVDTTNNIIIADSYGNYIANVPANSTVRIPYPINAAYQGSQQIASGWPASPGYYSIYNPNSASVNFIPSIVIWTNSVDYSIPQ